MKKLLIIVPLACLGASASAATVVTETENFSFIPNGSQTLTFDQFTLPPFAVLQSIKIDIELTKTGGSLGVDNESGFAASGQISQTVQIDLTSTDVTLTDAGFNAIGSNVSATSLSPVLNLGPDDGDNPSAFDADAGTDWALQNFVNVTQTDSGDVNSLVWAGYLGNATYDIFVEGIQFNDTAAFGGASGTFSPAGAEGFVRVTYTYVPEPTSALLALPALGLLLRRRRQG